MKPAKPRNKRPRASSALAAPPEEQTFAEVVEMIQAARGQALAAVNTALVDLYWQVGEYISRKLETAAWGEGVVDELARYIQWRHPNLSGFTRRNLFRMRQFFEAYKGDEKVSPLVRQLPWSHHLIILGQSKRPEEREFYLRLAMRARPQPCKSVTGGGTNAPNGVMHLQRLLSSRVHQLPDKELLQAKLHELYALTATETE